MIIASVANIVDRTEILIEKLDELLNGTILPDFLYVSISEYYPRLKKYYGDDNIKSLADKLKDYPIKNKLIIYKEDIGPSMKLLTPLKNHTFTDDDYILTFDDDTGLFKNAIECLTKVSNKYGPNAVYSIMGVKIQGSNLVFVHGEYMEKGDFYEIDGIGGFRGVLYPYKLIQPNNMISWINLFIEGFKKYDMIAMHDDHIFNEYMTLKKIPRLLVDVWPKIKNPDGPGLKINYNPANVSNGIFQDDNTYQSLNIFNLILNENVLSLQVQ